MLICVPLAAAELRALRAAPAADLRAHAPTGELCRALGYGVGMEEDAEFAALTYAGIDCLTRQPYRLVAVAEAPATDAGGEFGAVAVPALAWEQVRSLFTDGPEHRALARTAHAAVRGADLETAWWDDATQALLSEADLLWFAPDEADAVLAEIGD